MSSPQTNGRAPNLAEEAVALHCGYKIGYFEKRDIERWADGNIVALDVPPDEMLSLSMIRETQPLDVMNLLRALWGDTDIRQIAAIQIGFIGLDFQDGKLTLSDAISSLYSLRQQCNLSSHEEGMIYYIDDGYDLAVAGYQSTLAEVEQEFCAFVKPYAEALHSRYQYLMTFHSTE